MPDRRITPQTWNIVKDNLPTALLLFSICANIVLFFREKFVPVEVIAILQAEVRNNRTIDSLDALLSYSRDSLIVVDYKYIKELTEANTLMLCGLSRDPVTLKLPCARLEREWGIR